MRAFAAVVIVIAAGVLLIPSVQRRMVENVTRARIRSGFRDGLPFQRAVLVLFSMMMIFYALTAVL